MPVSERRPESLPRIVERGDRVIVQGQCAADVREDDVGTLGKHDAARITLEEVNAVRESVSRGELPRDFNAIFHLDREDAPRSGLACQQGENTGSASDFDEDVSGLYSGSDGPRVSLESPRIRIHGAVIV